MLVETADGRLVEGEIARTPRAKLALARNTEDRGGESSIRERERERQTRRM